MRVRCSKAFCLLTNLQFQRMEKTGDHLPRNSAQYERVVELLIMHKAKRTPREARFRSCLMIDLGRETDGNNEICLDVRFALCITFSFMILF